MRMPLALRNTCTLLAASVCLALATPAAAGSFTAFWDGTGGFGVSAAMAQDASDAGIPIIGIPGIEGFDQTTPELAVGHAIDLSTRVIPLPFGTAPATVTSNWSATNQSGINGPGDPLLDNLYLVFAFPSENTIVLNGQSQVVDYDPADVGLRLTSNEAGLADWVLLQVLVGGGNSVYYPAVSLGTLASGSTSPFQLFYTLDNPQVFSEAINLELGLPKWNLFFATTVVPEPSIALLLVLGLGAFAVAHRARL